MTTTDDLHRTAMEARGLPVASAEYSKREIIYEVVITPTKPERSQHPLRGRDNGNNNGWDLVEVGTRINSALLVACDILMNDKSDIPRKVSVVVYRE